MLGTEVFILVSRSLGELCNGLGAQVGPGFRVSCEMRPKRGGSSSILVFYAYVYAGDRVYKSVVSGSESSA